MRKGTRADLAEAVGFGEIFYTDYSRHGGKACTELVEVMKDER